MTDTPIKVEKLLSVRTIAEMFEVEESTVRIWLRTGKIKGVKLGQEWRVPESEIRSYIQGLYGSGE